jgi:uncharacterized protein YceH (UPF0502 family)
MPMHIFEGDTGLIDKRLLNENFAMAAGNVGEGVDALTARVAALEAQTADLESRVAALESVRSGPASKRD